MAVLLQLGKSVAGEGGCRGGEATHSLFGITSHLRVFMTRNSVRHRAWCTLGFNDADFQQAVHAININSEWLISGMSCWSPITTKNTCTALPSTEAL